jgi:hypothetical protein
MCFSDSPSRLSQNAARINEIYEASDGNRTLRPKAEKLAPRAADTSQQLHSPRSKAQEKAGKQSAVDEAEFRRQVNRSDSN